MISIGVFNAFSQAEEPDPKVSPALGYWEACFRETEDQQWSLKITGKVPSLSGCPIIIHSADRVLATFTIPHGTYTAENPLMLAIPADGITGDYRVVFLGGLKDVMGLHLPLSTLGHEVYGYTGFAQQEKETLWFMAPKDVPEFEFTAYSGSLRILDANGNSLGETAKAPESRNGALKLALAPDKVYGIDPLNIFMLGVKPGAYVAFNPKRLFLPDPRLREFAWWLDPNLTSSTPSKFTAPLWKPLPPENIK